MFYFIVFIAFVYFAFLAYLYFLQDKLIFKNRYAKPYISCTKNTKAGCVNAVFVNRDEIIPSRNIENLRCSVEFNKITPIDSTHIHI